MNRTAIFAPFLATMLLTLIVWFYMYSKRIPLIQKVGRIYIRPLPRKLQRILHFFGFKVRFYVSRGDDFCHRCAIGSDSDFREDPSGNGDVGVG
jgi:hypothetical protein